MTLAGLVFSFALYFAYLYRGVIRTVIVAKLSTTSSVGRRSCSNTAAEAWHKFGPCVLSVWILNVFGLKKVIFGTPDPSRILDGRREVES